MSKKEFSEEEIREIIKRASELQQKEEEEERATTKTLSLDEIIAVGKEAGLDIQNIKTAALEMRDKTVTRYSGFTDTHIFEEREIKLPINKSKAWSEVEKELRHHFGGENFGKTTSDTHNFEWSHLSISGIETLASLTEQEGNYKLRLSQRVGLASSLTEGTLYGAASSFVLTAVATGLFSMEVLSGAIMFAVCLVPLSVLVYTLDVAWRKKKLMRLKELADKLTAQIKTSLQSPSESLQPAIEIESTKERSTGEDSSNQENIKLRS